MMSRRGLALAGLLVTLAALGACRRADEQAAVTIVTTPDLAGTGLVESLARTFSAASNVRTHVLVTEERLIPALVGDGVADVVFTRSAALQQEIGRAAPIRIRHTIAYNDYLLVGPKSDRARAKEARTAAEALRRIARRDRAFCAPADVPDLRHREALLWRESPAEPSDDRRYRICRGTAMEVLQEASRRSAYTLTDRATFESAGSTIDLVPILERTPLLHNHVDLLLPRPKRRHRNAEWFVQWAMSFRGREVVERLRYDGERRFFAGER
jgi:tungstate transport system substrate-binding protein